MDLIRYLYHDVKVALHLRIVHLVLWSAHITRFTLCIFHTLENKSISKYDEPNFRICVVNFKWNNQIFRIIEQLMLSVWRSVALKAVE